MLYLNGLSPGLFERIDMPASNERRLCDYFGNSGVDFRLYGMILSVQIDEGYFHEFCLIDRRKRAGFPA
jgi:hypothetical protein